MYLVSLKKQSLCYLLLLISSCSSVPKKNIDFETLISDDGSKRFIFSIDLKAKERGRDSIKNRRPFYRSIPQKEQLEQKLKRLIEQNNYCTSGYFIYDRRLHESKYQLLGECNESAN